MDLLIAFLVASGASVIGGICGIGGGILMKPLLDMIGFASIATISFLSSMTVLAMSGVRAVQSVLLNRDPPDIRSLAPLALGAATGGIAGKVAFGKIAAFLPSPDTVGAVQALLLALVSIGTAVFTIQKSRIKTKTLSSSFLSVVIGFALGTLSSFLGIGGGPINIPVLIYFFSMDSRKAAESSLFIIVISQLFSFLYTLISKTLPEFDVASIIVMVVGGSFGGVFSSLISGNLSNEKIDKLFVCLLGVIVLICVYNFCKYSKFV